MSNHIIDDARVNNSVNEQQQNIKVNTRTPFFITPNKFIQDPKLHPETKVVGCFLQSLPEKWTIHPKWIQEQLGISRRSWLKAATQLKELNLLTLVQGGPECGSYYMFSFFGNEVTELVEPRIPKTHSRTDSPKLVSLIKKTEKQLFNKKENIYVDLKADDPLPDPVIEIFEYWQAVLNHPRSILDDKRKRSIQKALKDYSITDLKKAIDGCKNTPFNMGENKDGFIHDDITLILRSSTNIERFIGNLVSKPRVGKKSFSERETTAFETRKDRLMKMVTPKRVEKDVTNETLLIR
ncbi:MAG: hypothetical protein ACHP9Y_01275 [Gammaproteobacteria bacterium]